MLKTLICCVVLLSVFSGVMASFVILQKESYKMSQKSEQLISEQNARGRFENN